MTSKERISTRADSKDLRRHKISSKSQIKVFQIFYKEQKILKVQIESDKTVGDLNKLIKNKLKDRFYNFMGLQSLYGYEVLDFALLDLNFTLININQNQKFRILLEGEVQDLYMPTLNDLAFLKCLGKGASSTVYLVRHNQSCKMYALKQIDKRFVDGFKKMEAVLRQRKILIETANKSPFTSKIYSTFQSRNHLNFLLQYYPGGQLLYHLQDRRFKQNELKLYFSQILLAIESLHKQKIIFRDLKPQNIVIDLEGNAILSDFGLCKTNVRKEQLTISYCGSDMYMPPQVKQRIGYNYHADFYTLGALLYQMATGLPPYYNDMTLSFPQTLSKQAVQITSRLLQSDLNKRLCDIEVIKSDKWLKDIVWGKILRKQYQMSIKINPYRTYIHEEFRQVSVIREANQIAFDRLFDFFYFMAPGQRGISKCYIISGNGKQKQEQLRINKMGKNSQTKKQKDRTKSHKNSAQQLPRPKLRECLKCKQQPINSKRSQKSTPKLSTSKDRKLKNSKNKFIQTSPYLLTTKKDNLLRKQKTETRIKIKIKRDKSVSSQRSNSENNQQNLNIYQKSSRKLQKAGIQMVSARSGSNLNEARMKSLKMNIISSKSISNIKTFESTKNIQKSSNNC